MPGRPQFDTTAIRRLVQRRVDDTSLRAVADEIGVSKSGLDSFLRGREPYQKTRLKLTAWFMRQRPPDSSSVRPAEVDAAIALLERYIQSVGTDAIRQRRVREVASRLFADTGDDAKETKDTKDTKDTSGPRDTKRR